MILKKDFYLSNKICNKYSIMKINKKEISRKRHILKTITWRIIGTLDTMLIAWIISGDPMIGLSIGAAEIITKMILYLSLIHI